MKIEKVGTDRGVIKSFLLLHCIAYGFSFLTEVIESADCDPRGSARKMFTSYRTRTGVPKLGWILSPKLEMIIPWMCKGKLYCGCKKGFKNRNLWELLILRNLVRCL